MPLTINSCIFYSTSEACKMAGTNRNTFLRWVREKRVVDVKTRDRNGWRLFTEEDVGRLKDVVNHTVSIGPNITED
jgi:DNA-binding transcriptional MerR regulator